MFGKSEDKDNMSEYTSLEGFEKYIRKLIEDEPAEKLYKDEKLKNRTGWAYNTKISFSEIAAEIMNEQFKKISQEIKSLENEKGYFLNHDKLSKKDEEENLYPPNPKGIKNFQIEKWKAKSFCNIKENVEGLGKFCYFEMPITRDSKSERQTKEKEGKVDLISYKNKNIHIIEIKKNKSRETLLRCIMEIYTYYKQLNINEVINQFNKKFNEKAEHIIPTILIYQNKTKENAAPSISEIADNLKDKYRNQRELLYKMAEDIGTKIQIFKITKDKEKYDDTIAVEKIEY